MRGEQQREPAAGAREDVGAGRFRHAAGPSRRRRPLPAAGIVRAQCVPRAAHRLEPYAAARPVQLAPQPAGVHVDDVGERVELVVPGVVEDPVATQDLVRVQQEEAQQAELLGAQRQWLATVPDHPRRRVEGQRSERQDRRQGATRPAQESADARQQFLEGERLDEVVVGAAVQAGDLVGRRIPRRQHQHRQREALLAELPAESEPVDAGQHDVEDQQVVGELVGRAGGVEGRRAGPRSGGARRPRRTARPRRSPRPRVPP